MGKTQDEDIVHAYNLIHSVISDIAIFRENIENDFHDWFMDASRIGSELGIVLTVPRLSGRQQHRANAGPENPDPKVYYRININVAIPFLDHMEQVLNNRFHSDSMVGSHLFYLVPTLIINHSDLQDLAKCLLFWERDLPSASSLLSELKQWQRFWKLKSESLDNIIPADLEHCIHAADEDVFPNIRVLLIIACTIPVSSCKAERSFSALRRIKSYLRNTMSSERFAGLALMHLHSDVDTDIDEVCEAFNTTEKCFNLVFYTNK